MPFYICILALFMSTSLWGQEQSQDIALDTAQATAADSISDDSIVVISQVNIKVLNTFEDSKAHTSYERGLYDFLHLLRFKTKPSVIRKNLLFQEGDSVAYEKVIESERNLRRNRFISDAQIELVPNPDGTYSAFVSSSDNWTTNLALNLSKPGEQWFYNLGLVEYDFLGYGIEAGALYSKGPERTSEIYIFKDPHFILKNHTLSTSFQNNSDGSLFNFQFQKPFISKDDQWGYTGKWFHSYANKYLYLSRTENTAFQQDPIRVSSPIQESLYKKGHQTIRYSGVYTDSMSLRLSYAQGKKWKHYYKGIFDRRTFMGAPAERLSLWGENCVQLESVSSVGNASRPDLENYYQDLCSEIDDNDSLKEATYLGFGIQSSEAPDLFSRRDAIVALSYTIQYLNYSKVKNLNGAKWTEDIDLGFTLENRLGRNIPELGARQWETYFLHKLNFLEMFHERHFIQGNFSMDYFLADNSNETEFGSQKAYLGYIYKAGIWSTVAKTHYSAYFNSPQSRQLQLGGFQGLTGFPDFYYSGQALGWFSLEQRMYPEWELATAIPVPAIFFSGGNGWEHIEEMDWRELEYSAGLGLRVGLSKSVLGIVNHLNVSWPLNGPREDGLQGAVFTITTEANF